MNEELCVNCAACATLVCRTAESQKGPDYCATRIEADVIAGTRPLYQDPELAEFARNASLVEAESYIRVPWYPAHPSPATTRLEEIINFCRKMKYKKLGVAYCAGLVNEVRILVPILESKGFQVLSVCCKHGGIPKEEIGIKDSEKVRPGRWESMCNPISQAQILNKEKTDFNIVVGLCVGHDSLFLKHAEAMTTVFVVKDRLLGHNPVVALYQASGYYRRVKEGNL
ncbi:MAG: DUF1847 domain-containing protein [Chloroflexi bacterium]|nr:DUF1847 domain-containing protein [Chloroflexota bacterium]